MARKDFLTRSKSIYTISRKHMPSTEGTIYEKDHVTIITDDGIYDERPMFSDSNFKFKIGTDKNGKKRHVRGTWIKPVEGESGETWTLSNLSGHVTTEETRIVNKPNYSSLSDFAYYGSAVELIKATVNDIILRFPGGLSYYGKNAPTIFIGDDKYFLVSNEFDIDFWTQGTVFSGDVKNPMRVLSASYTNYVDREGEQISEPVLTIDGDCLDSIIGTLEVAGETLLIYLNGDGRKILVTKEDKSESTVQERIIIRPKQDIIDKFWYTLDDFERVLLNRDTTPIYKAEFETPYFTDEGFYYNVKTYVWPTVGDDGFTPDITTGAYQGYLSSLISLAEFHDGYDADNIWRMLTHEAIKNLDWTFIRQEDGESVDMTDFDVTRVQALLRIAGRQYDDIKLYAENIKSTNSVTYNEKNNVPDYFLTDKVEYDGWEARTIAPINDKDVTCDVISGETADGNKWVLENSGKTPSMVNSDFMRRLVLNSPYINSLKGTKRGIKTILGMFGYDDVSDTVGSGNTETEGTFNIREYVAIAHNFPDYMEAARLRARGEYVNYDSNVNYMEGYPVTTVLSPNGNVYLIPWYDKEAKYRNPFYFQEKGGWAKTNKRSINLGITSFTEIAEMDDVKIYGESESYMRFASSLEDMTEIDNTDVFENMICYVSDISAMMNGYATSPEDKLFENSILSSVTTSAMTEEEIEEERFKLYSHYFILKSVPLSTIVGYVDNEIYNCYGWRNIYNIEFNGEGTLTKDGLRVLYLESTDNDVTGNNPHIGNGKYDDGANYIRRFNYLFEEPVKEGIYDFLRNSTDPNDNADYNALLTSGFCVTFMTPENVDNKKCHYFEDTNVESAETDLSYLVENDGEWEKADDPNREDWEEEFYENLVIPLQESGYVTSNHDEAAANSVINVKNIRINFGTGGNIYLRQYIEKVVLKYLATMIPSTAILSYTFDGEEISDDTTFELEGARNLDEIVAEGAILDNEDSYIENNG